MIPQKKRGWSLKHPCAQTVRVRRGLREGANACKRSSLTCLKLGVSVVYLHSCINGLLYFRILEVLSKALFYLVLIIQ